MYRTSKETQKRKDEKRQMLLESAAMVFSEKGYHNTTVKDIVEKASASVGSFYFYFDSKEKLFHELYWSVVKQFNDITTSVLDVESYPMLKNFTRVMTATLWMYEQKREIARVTLLEVAATDPAFRKIEADRLRESALDMAAWFKRFMSHNEVYIPDERVAALMYLGSYNLIINDWLSSGASVPLTEHCYEFCVYNLQAVRIPFNENIVRQYINEALIELTARSANQQ